jgi:hypothetical protein
LGAPLLRMRRRPHKVSVVTPAEHMLREVQRDLEERRRHNHWITDTERCWRCCERFPVSDLGLCASCLEQVKAEEAS